MRDRGKVITQWLIALKREIRVGLVEFRKVLAIERKGLEGEIVR